MAGEFSNRTTLAPRQETLRVLDVLREKHPAMRDPDLTGPNPGAFDPYASTPDALQMPLNITATDVLLRRSLRSSRGVLVPVVSTPWISATGSCDLAQSRKHCERS